MGAAEGRDRWTTVVWRHRRFSSKQWPSWRRPSVREDSCVRLQLDAWKLLNSLPPFRFYFLRNWIWSSGMPSSLTARLSRMELVTTTYPSAKLLTPAPRLVLRSTLHSPWPEHNSTSTSPFFLRFPLRFHVGLPADWRGRFSPSTLSSLL